MSKPQWKTTETLDVTLRELLLELRRAILLEMEKTAENAAALAKAIETLEKTPRKRREQ